MGVDRYTRAVLTVIAGTLVYICIALTPMPSASAQRAARPGDDTGPARVVIVGWESNTRVPVPVQVVDSVTLKTTGEMRVTGTVQTEQTPRTIARVVLAGWEERGSAVTPGVYRSLDSQARDRAISGIPVTEMPVR
jgi:hypothetical protein